MARQKGFDKKVGTIGDQTFFKRGNAYFVRSRTSLTRERVLSDPAFAGSRMSMTEFGACSLAASQLRRGLMPLPKLFGDSSTWNRLVSTFQDFLSNSKGRKGSRSILFTRSHYFFEGFEFNQKSRFNAVFFAPVTIDFNENRAQVVIRSESFDPLKQIKAPKGATHYRLISACCVMSDFKLNKQRNVYGPVVPEVSGQSKVKFTDFLPLTMAQQKRIVLKYSIKGVEALPPSTAMVVCTGVEFYQQSGERFYLLESGRAMKIARIVAGGL